MLVAHYTSPHKKTLYIYGHTYRRTGSRKTISKNSCGLFAVTFIGPPSGPSDFQAYALVKHTNTCLFHGFSHSRDIHRTSALLISKNEYKKQQKKTLAKLKKCCMLPYKSIIFKIVNRRIKHETTRRIHQNWLGY